MVRGGRLRSAAHRSVPVRPLRQGSCAQYGCVSCLRSRSRCFVPRSGMGFHDASQTSGCAALRLIVCRYGEQSSSSSRHGHSNCSPPTTPLYDSDDEPTEPSGVVNALAGGYLRTRMGSVSTTSNTLQRRCSCRPGMLQYWHLESVLDATYISSLTSMVCFLVGLQRTLLHLVSSTERGASGRQAHFPCCAPSVNPQHHQTQTPPACSSILQRHSSTYPTKVLQALTAANTGGPTPAAPNINLHPRRCAAAPMPCHRMSSTCRANLGAQMGKM